MAAKIVGALVAAVVLVLAGIGVGAVVTKPKPPSTAVQDQEIAQLNSQIGAMTLRLSSMSTEASSVRTAATNLATQLQCLETYLRNERDSLTSNGIIAFPFLAC